MLRPVCTARLALVEVLASPAWSRPSSALVIAPVSGLRAPSHTVQAEDTPVPVNGPTPVPVACAFSAADCRLTPLSCRSVKVAGGV